MLAEWDVYLHFNHPEIINTNVTSLNYVPEILRSCGFFLKLLDIKWMLGVHCKQLPESNDSSVCYGSRTPKEKHPPTKSKPLSPINGPVTRAYFRRIIRRMSSFSNTSRSLYTSFVYAPNTLAYALTTSHTAKPQEEF